MALSISTSCSHSPQFFAGHGFRFAAPFPHPGKHILGHASIDLRLRRNLDDMS